MVKLKIEQLASVLEEFPRAETDLETAKMLRDLGRIYQVAYEMVWAKTHEHSKAAYLEMIDLIKGKQGV